MKRNVRVISMVCVIITIMSIFSVAFAAGLTYKRVDTKYYTIQTGRRASTLTFTANKSGEIRQKFTKKTWLRTKTKYGKVTAYAHYALYVDGKRYTVVNGHLYGKTKKIPLKANKTYNIKLEYIGFRPEGADIDHLMIRPVGWTTSGDRYWYSYPSVKISVNNWATLR